MITPVNFQSLANCQSIFLEVFQEVSLWLVWTEGEPRLELGVHVFGIMWYYFGIRSSIVFYLEMKVEVQVGVHDIRSRFTPRFGQ